MLVSPLPSVVVLLASRVPLSVVQLTVAPATGLPAPSSRRTTRGAEGWPACRLWPSPETGCSEPGAATVRLKLTLAVAASWRVAVTVTGPVPAPAVTVALAWPEASVGPPGTSTASPATAQVMPTPAAGVPLLSASTTSGSSNALPGAACWPSPPAMARPGAAAMAASKETDSSSPLAGTPSGSKVAVIAAG